MKKTAEKTSGYPVSQTLPFVPQDFERGKPYDLSECETKAVPIEGRGAFGAGVRFWRKRNSAGSAEHMRTSLTAAEGFFSTAAGGEAVWCVSNITDAGSTGIFWGMPWLFMRAGNWQAGSRTAWCRSRPQKQGKAAGLQPGRISGSAHQQTERHSPGDPAGCKNKKNKISEKAGQPGTAEESCRCVRSDKTGEGAVHSGGG